MDLLKDAVLDPDSSKWVDAVIFISMKTERLTATGLQKLSAVETIDGVRKEVAIALCDILDEEEGTFDEVCEELSEKRVLLFVDNLETLLRDFPESFDEFALNLPDQWRVLVTSRVSVNGSSVVPLDPLKENFGGLLARLYSERRGLNLGGDEVFNSIAKKCYCNPLAIRLSIDLFANGKSIPESINVANKEIAEFSYSNLIDSLSSSSVECLEALFVEGSLTRADLCELLDKSVDDVAASIAILARTSLIGRSVDGFSERYELSLSIRDLLIRNPRNIAVRTSIQEKISKRHQLALQIKNSQRDKNITHFDADYIPDGISENLQLLLKEINSASKKNAALNIAALLHRKIVSVESIYGGIPEFHFGCARILEKIMDAAGAEKQYSDSIKLRNNYPSAKLALAKMYSSNSKFEDAEPLFQELVNDGFGDVDKTKNREFSLGVVSGYFYSLLYQHKHEVIVEKTKDWKVDKFFCGVLGAFRAAALKRSVENLVDSDPDKTMGVLLRAIKILDDVIRREGYFDISIGQCFKLIEEFEFVLSRRAYSSNLEFCEKALDFASRHMVELSDKSKSKEFMSKAFRTFSRINIQENPFGEMGSAGGGKSSEMMSLEASGYIMVDVTRIPYNNGRPTSYIFASDGESEEYFLHNEYFKGGRQAWFSLNVGDKLAIKVSSVKNKRNIEASEILIVN